MKMVCPGVHGLNTRSMHPGLYTGYGVKTLPGIREAIEQRDWKAAQENIEIVSKTIEAYTQQVQRAMDIINSSPATGINVTNRLCKQYIFIGKCGT